MFAPPTVAVAMPSITVRLTELMQEKTVRDKRYKAVTQEEVAEAIGISRATMSDWVQGKVNRLDKDILAKLCQYFDCEIQDLLYLKKD